MVISEDVPRFYAALDQAGEGADTAALAAALRREYFAPGSAGLASFLDARIGSAEDLARVVSSRADYYEAVRPSLVGLASDATVQARVRSAFARLNEWIPEAEFADTYLLIGRMNSAGTVGDAGLLIGLEMFGRGPGVPTESLDRWASMSIRDPDHLVFTIVHESIHTLQRGGRPRTLLEATVHEGVCEFLASQATGMAPRTAAYGYARAREAEVWAEFSVVMHGMAWGDWLYAIPSDATRPPDLAYALGAFICEAYWAATPDKQAAARTLLDSRKASEVLRVGGYSPR